MPKFLTELDVKCIDDGQWELVSPLKYRSDVLIIDDNLGMITVPAGFQTDFASVPRVPVFYMLFGDRAHRESVLHDALYRIDSVPVVERGQADDVFLEAMAERGKGFFTRYAMFYGVRIAGWTAFHKKKMSDKL